MVLNVLYAFVIVISVYGLYNVINLAITTITGNFDTVPLGVEPILFGVFCMGFDILFVGMKNLMKDIIAQARQKARRE